MIHSAILLVLMLVAAPLASYIALTALAGVLVVVCWNMFEKQAFATLLRASRGDALVLMATFLIVVFRDLTEGIVVGSMRWTAFMANQKDIGGVAVSRGPKTSVSQKWRYWRCGLADGTRVVAGDKPGGKSSLAAQHEKLATAEDVEHWRTYWKALLKKF